VASRGTRGSLRGCGTGSEECIRGELISSAQTPRHPKTHAGSVDCTFCTGTTMPGMGGPRDGSLD
jgi:hypothetical protein